MARLTITLVLLLWNGLATPSVRTSRNGVPVVLLKELVLTRAGRLPGSSRKVIIVVMPLVVFVCTYVRDEGVQVCASVRMHASEI